MMKIKTAFNESIESGAVVYVSGPMSGYPNNNVERFNFVCSIFREKLKDVTVINPAEQDQNLSWEEVMKNDLDDVNRATHLAFLGGWNLSRGARMEMKLAIDRGIKIIDGEKLLKKLLNS